MASNCAKALSVHASCVIDKSSNLPTSPKFPLSFFCTFFGLEFHIWDSANLSTLKNTQD